MKMERETNNKDRLRKSKADLEETLSWELGGARPINERYRKGSYYEDNQDRYRRDDRDREASREYNQNRRHKHEDLFISMIEEPREGSARGKG